MNDETPAVADPEAHAGQEGPDAGEKTQAQNPNQGDGSEPEPRGGGETHGKQERGGGTGTDASQPAEQNADRNEPGQTNWGDTVELTENHRAELEKSGTGGLPNLGTVLRHLQNGKVVVRFGHQIRIVSRTDLRIVKTTKSRIRRWQEETQEAEKKRQPKRSDVEKREESNDLEKERPTDKKEGKEGDDETEKDLARRKPTGGAEEPPTSGTAPPKTGGVAGGGGRGATAAAGTAEGAGAGTTAAGATTGARGGAAAGAAAGARTGAAAGPWGAVIGAVVGLLASKIGKKTKEKAKKGGFGEPQFSVVDMVIGFTVSAFLDIIVLKVNTLLIKVDWTYLPTLLTSLVQWGTWLIFVAWFWWKGIREDSMSKWLKKRLSYWLLQILPDWLIPFQLMISFFITVLIQNGWIGKITSFVSKARKAMKGLGGSFKNITG